MDSSIPLTIRIPKKEDSSLHRRKDTVTTRARATAKAAASAAARPPDWDAEKADRDWLPCALRPPGLRSKLRSAFTGCIPSLPLVGIILGIHYTWRRQKQFQTATGSLGPSFGHGCTQALHKTGVFIQSCFKSDPSKVALLVILRIDKMQRISTCPCHVRLPPPQGALNLDKYLCQRAPGSS